MKKSVSGQYPVSDVKIYQNIHILVFFKVFKMECFQNKNPVFLDGKLLCRRPDLNRHVEILRGILSPLSLVVKCKRYPVSIRFLASSVFQSGNIFYGLRIFQALIET